MPVFMVFIDGGDYDIECILFKPSKTKTRCRNPGGPSPTVNVAVSWVLGRRTLRKSEGLESCGTPRE
ncbi:hypothetical protein ANO11243_017920 [Dothideomycetidae sp. 11243]|nr:hypothetical protein ANO11243_017920 [fungal sp. No.11243]